MRLSLLVVPLAIVAIILGGIIALGSMTVQSAAISTRASIELLRIHTRVAALHEELTGTGHGSTRSHLDAVEQDAGVEDGARTPDGGATDEPATGPGPTSVPPGESAPDFVLVSRDR